MEIKEQKKFIYSDLVWLNVNYFILKKIKTFPFKELNLEVRFAQVMNSMVKNYFENSIIIVRRLYYDTNSDFISLKLLKNEILKEKNKTNRSFLNSKIKDKENTLQAYDSKINNLRHKRLAHLSQSLTWNPSKEYGISLSQLNEIIQALNGYYKSLFELDNEAQFIPLSYRPQVTDIDILLESLAGQSELLTMCESDPHKWKQNIKLWKNKGKLKDRLQIINKYRQKLLELGPVG